MPTPTKHHNVNYVDLLEYEITIFWTVDQGRRITSPLYDRLTVKTPD